MRDDHRAGPIDDGVGEDFARVDDRPVYQAHGDDADRDEFVGTVEGCAEKTFLLPIGPMCDERMEIARSRYSPFPNSIETPTQFEGCRYRCRLRFAHAGKRAQFGRVGRLGSGFDEGENLFGQRQHALSLDSRSENRRKQLGVSEMTGALL